jgi:multiple sugar transport system permease protein
MRRLKKIELFPYILVIPALIITFIFSIYPVVYAVQLSFHDVQLVHIGAFIGLDNYDLIFGDPRIGADIVNSFVFTFGSMAGTITLGLIFAIILNERLRFRTLFRATLLVPWVVTEVVSMVLVKWMLNYDAGLLNLLLASLGLTKIQFLGSLDMAMFTVVGANIWRATAYSMVMILAGLQSIPDSVFEAARLDGVSFFRRIFSIVIPLVKAPLLVIIVITTISYFNRVTPILVLTGGGPMVATETLGVRMYLEAFNNMRMGEAAVIGVIIFFINLVLILGYVRTIRLEKYY